MILWSRSFLKPCFELCEGPYKIPFIKKIVSNGIEHQLTAEDNTKDEEKFKTKDEITSDMLVEILEESIKTLWHFIKADKDASCLSHKRPRETQAKFQDPADSELHIELQAELHKVMETCKTNLLCSCEKGFYIMFLLLFCFLFGHVCRRIRDLMNFQRAEVAY